MKCKIKSYKKEEIFYYPSDLNIISHRIDESIKKQIKYSIIKLETSLYKLQTEYFCFFLCNRSFNSLIVDFYTDNGELVQENVELIGYHRFNKNER